MADAELLSTQAERLFRNPLLAEAMRIGRTVELVDEDFMFSLAVSTWV
jgi:hypothetical protein